MTCCVCHSARVRPFGVFDERRYFRCDDCLATFVDRAQVPSPAEQKRVYDAHENDVHDPKYRTFLTKLADPLCARLEKKSSGLDFGCGPGPALADILCGRGHDVALYDPHYAPDASVLARTYDFVTCTETIEHFAAPGDDFATLVRLLKPDGWLALMTCFQTDDARFERWHYRRDPTHVVFYKEHTLRRLAAQHGLHCEIPVKDVALMRR